MRGHYAFAQLKHNYAHIYKITRLPLSHTNCCFRATRIQLLRNG